MPSSSTSTFGELDEFEAALRTQTDVDLLVTEQGRFRGRLTQVALHQVHLVAADETVPRIAFISIRPDLTLAWWALGRHGSQIWCGTPSLADEIVTFGPGARVKICPNPERLPVGRTMDIHGRSRPPLASDHRDASHSVERSEVLATERCGIANSARAARGSYQAIRKPRERGSDGERR